MKKILAEKFIAGLFLFFILIGLIFFFKPGRHFLLASQDSAPFGIVRINSGGEAYQDQLRNLWAADAGFIGGQTYSTTTGIGGTQDQVLYQNERYNLTGYKLNVPNGFYQVTLKFAEIYAYCQRVDCRVFNVSLEGREVLTNFDIFKEAGGYRALDKSFSTEVKDGVLEIGFQTVRGAAKIAAVKITQDPTREIPILLLKYFPPDPVDPGRLNTWITGPEFLPETRLEVIKERVDRLTNELMIALEKGSSYHGYKEQGARPRLVYRLLEAKEFFRPILRTDNPLWGFKADHLNELRELNICDYVENRGLKEVWLWMYHYTPDLDHDGRPDKDPQRFFVAPEEANMAGPYGDKSHDWHDDLPICSKSYTVYEYNYARGLGEALENHTHQLEAIFTSVGGGNFWPKFVGLGPNSNRFACGWTHCPPNVMDDCDRHQYDWANERSILSDCEDWNKERTGQVSSVSCHNWAGAACDFQSGDKFKIWWMQNLPSTWWVFLGDFDWAMSEIRDLTNL